MYVIIIEPDRILAQLLKNELQSKNISSDIASTPASAMQLIDASIPKAVITELSLSSHSAMEFLYEMRTYPDLQLVPVFVYTSLLIDDSVRLSQDWFSLGITCDYYKPHTSIATVIDGVASILES